MMFLKIMLVFVLFSDSNAMAQSVEDPVRESFQQEIKTDIELPGPGVKNVLYLFSTSNDIVAITPQSMYTLNEKSWSQETINRAFHLADLDSKEQIWMVHDESVENQDGTSIIDLPLELSGDKVYALQWECDVLHIGTEDGVYSYRDGVWSQVEATANKKVNALTLDNRGRIWAATDAGLVRRQDDFWLNLDLVLMSSGTEELYLDVLASPKDELLFSSPHSVGAIAENGDHWMNTGHDGLPYGPVTHIATAGGAIWFGTDKGAIKRDSTWHYYHGQRWLPDQKINDILILDSSRVWLATPSGISEIKTITTTLENKSSHYLDIIQQRHDRLGLINASLLETAGDLSTSRKVSQDNDGLWTATFLAAESFRYAVTKSADARENAIRTFEAIERLETVTGIPGLPARSYARSTDSVRKSRSPHPKVWRPSPDPEWQWLDDCSSDEVVGHMFALSIFYDLVANDEQQQAVRGLVRRTTDHILENDYMLIDYDGKPTRWGVWNPDSLNHSPRWAYEKGLYSLEILSFLKTVLDITGDIKYEDAYQLLIEEHGYAKNAVEAKIHGPYENSHSDDILTYFPYYLLAKHAKGDPYWPLYKKSIERTWTVSRPERMPAWNIIASIALERDCDIQIAKEELQLFPMDLIDWDVKNSHRWDLIENRLRGRGFSRQATTPIPTPEARIWRWNTNPYQFDMGAGGKKEVTSTYYLLPYWMAKYHQLIE